MNIPAAPTAATPPAPVRPTQIISTMLYAIWMREVPMIGSASRVRGLMMLPLKRSIRFAITAVLSVHLIGIMPIIADSAGKGKGVPRKFRKMYLHSPGNWV